jgi:hypothetical protein
MFGHSQGLGHHLDTFASLDCAKLSPLYSFRHGLRDLLITYRSLERTLKFRDMLPI